MKELPELKKKALAMQIPIMQEDGLSFMIDTFSKEKCHTCLEIGSAIGYSSIMMVHNISEFKVETIELDSNRYQEAVRNIEEYGYLKEIMIHHADALQFEINDLQYSCYDCLFIDGAKAQYQKFFEKYMPLVKQDGICIVDNLDFHGMIYDIDHIKNRNTKQLVKKIKRFKDWIFDNEKFEVTYYSIGDGICIIKRR